MKKGIIIIILSLLVYSCEYIPTFKAEAEKIPVAQVYDKTLYLSDIKEYIPVDVSPQDSTLFVKNYIDSWAKEQLILRQAEINLTDEVSSFEKLVSDYRSALYINSYKEALVLDKLDTEVNEAEIETYYNDNFENFRLNEELVQFKYLEVNNQRADKKDLIKWFRSKKEEEFNQLNTMTLEFNSHNFNDSMWVKYTDMKSRIMVLQDMDKNRILKKSNFIQKEDSLNLYLILINDVLKRNEIAPKNYVSPTIKQIILQKRKLELLRKIEVDLLEDAIKNQNFEKY